MGKFAAGTPNRQPGDWQTPDPLRVYHRRKLLLVSLHASLPTGKRQSIPIPDLAEMFDQIDANLRFQGPGGGLQIPGGDVIDAYWRAGRSKELVQIVGYAVSVGLVPMLMTHGQTLLGSPGF